jgi:FtsZ-binding cell division protein ZapB
LIQKIKTIDLDISKIIDDKKFKIDQLKNLMKSLQEDLKPKITQSKTLKEERQVRQNKLNTLQTKMEALVKEFYLKRKWRREDL